MNITINEVLSKAANGTLVPSDVWYDWFCSDKSLVNRTKSLIPKLKMIAKSPRINPETATVFFKNNCPMVGKLYDSISICDGESNDVRYWVTPSSGHKVKMGMAEVWDGVENREFTGVWGDVKNFFLHPGSVEA